MTKLLNLLFIAGILIICAGCDHSININEKSFIQSKSKAISDENYYYRIRCPDTYDICLILPDNFGNVGDKITITNGIHAWPSK